MKEFAAIQRETKKCFTGYMSITISQLNPAHD